MRITESTIQSFKVAKIFKENTDKINSVTFSQSGEFLISSSNDDSIVIYDCVQGNPKRTLNSKKYGVDLIQLTHNNDTAVHASTKVDDTIRYLSLHDNKYIRYFPGHSKKVTTLCMSPVDDTFLSGSLDKTLRLWDLRSNNCQGIMNLPSRPVAAFDPEGLIFATGINSECIKLYDLRSYDKGPFSNFLVDSTTSASSEKDGADWTGLKFSPDGRSILIYTNGTAIRLIDAFKGHVTHTFGGHANVRGQALEATFSPDAQYLFSGSSDGKLHCWHIETGAKTVFSSEKHKGSIHCCQFNPKYMMLATTSDNMAFWIPDGEDS